MKQKTKWSIKKRFFRTKGGKWKLMRAKAWCRHRLIPKSKRQKALGSKNQNVSAANVKAVAAYI